MKYYKLIKDAIHYPSFTPNKIYPESFAPRWCSVLDHYKSNLNNGSWIEVPAGEYFVQEGKMPEYFAIKKVADNPLWQKYIDWLNTAYEKELEGCNDYYYGYDGISGSKEIACYRYIILFNNNPVELTLEQWDKIINKTMEEEFKLQKVWFIELTEENAELVEKWHRKISKFGNLYDIGSFYGVYSDGSGDAWSFSSLPKNTQVITTEQFIKYVLNKEVMKEKEIIGWKLKEDCKKYEEACISISELSVYPALRGYYCIGKNSVSIDSFKKAGVLELWFDPVHEEKTLKFGGYDVTFEKVTSGVRISCNSETGTFSQIEAIYNYFKPNSINFKFGSQEVRKVIYDKKEWNIAPDDDEPASIKIGCTTGNWSEFVAIYEEAKSML